MSTISAASGSYLSPLQMLQQELKTEVASGTIASTDQDALSSALTAIDSALTSDRASKTSTKPPSKEEMDAKISDLIDQQVSAGSLTSDQASELKELFSNTFSPAQGPQGAGGPPPGPPPSEASATSSSDSTSSTSASSTDISQILQEFLKLLQDSQSSSSYSADGNSSSSTTVQALLINYTA